MRNVFAGCMAMVACMPVYADGFDTPAAAAVYALSQAMAAHSCTETAGVVIWAGGGYTLSVPVTGTDDRFTLRVALHAGERIVALWHTHPDCEGAPNAGIVSPQDIETATALRVPSYIGVQSTGVVKVYVPGVTRTYRTLIAGSLRMVSDGTAQ